MTAHHHHTTDWGARGAELEREGEIHGTCFAAAAAWLREVTDLHGTAVRRVLDVGSGPGVATCLLARAFPQAEAVAVDGSPDLLDRARERAAAQGLAGRLSTRRAGLPEDFGALPPADLIWSSKAVHHLGDQQAALDALAATLRRGGVLAVAERVAPPRCLPRDTGIGRPGLQSRLDALYDEGFTEMRERLPGSVRAVEDWRAMLTAAGLTPTGTRTFLVDLPAPPSPQVREQAHAHLSRLRDRAGDRLDAEDRDALEQLLDRAAPTGVLRRPDVFWLSTLTVHTARAA
ncbi:class I SAM-dependent methyltransferase [Streptomyces gamaensis]|uniref:Class I SAM-dependent methyltransferase n=1 Tax=Streptomyces gamaensis TaxID=1763542 RepID=A0ABW0ZC72_9ACTN